MPMSKKAYAAFCEFCDSEGEALEPIDILNIGHSLTALGLAKMSADEREARIDSLDASIARAVQGFIAAEQKKITLN